MRRYIASLLMAASLTACFTAGKRGGDVAPAVYDLGQAGQAVDVVTRRRPMAIEVRAPLWFDSLGIDYRLGYLEPNRLREYSRARWVGPPAQLIQLRLIRDLGYIPSGQAKAACVLRVNVDEFSQVFDKPEESRGVLQGRVQWFDKGRGLLLEKTFNLQTPAPSPDSLGGVAAMSRLVGDLSNSIVEWEGSGGTVLRDCLY
ncbi:MAG: hypothetical protein D3M94_16470 [Rhodocyclales bacterium GT-UBC]|nr:MAG: hypothetical protein D3M94_16470 [Rhodocyclales bacterium GT-UBC]